MTLDLALNNSVMHVFCKLLLKQRKQSDSKFNDGDSEAGKHRLMEDGMYTSSSPVSGQRMAFGNISMNRCHKNCYMFKAKSS